MQGSTIIPSTRYRDAYAAIDWLCNVFGFTKHAVYGDGTVVHHAQLTLGAGMFMLGSAAKGNENEYSKHLASLDETGGRDTVSLCLSVPDTDLDPMLTRAEAAGAEIIQPMQSPPHGGRSFACRDLEGHIWWVGSYDPWASA